MSATGNRTTITLAVHLEPGAELGACDDFKNDRHDGFTNEGGAAGVVLRHRNGGISWKVGDKPADIAWELNTIALTLTVNDETLAHLTAMPMHAEGRGFMTRCDAYELVSMHDPVNGYIWWARFAPHTSALAEATSVS